MKNKINWIIPSVTYALAIPTLIFGLIFMETIEGTDYVLLFLAPLLPFVFPLYSKVFKKEFPVYLNLMICIEIAISIYGGTIFDLYDVIPAFDLFLHGYFGFSCSMVLFYITIQLKLDKLQTGFLLFFIFLATMGVGALWELWEYICDLVTGGDALRIEESISLGKLPVADSMEDLAVTILGFIIFSITFVIDKKWIHKLYNDFYDKDIKNE